MILDHELVFCENKDLKSAFTSKSIDLGQKDPQLGLEPFYLVIIPTIDGTGNGTVTFALEHSDNNTAFETAVTTGALKVAEFTKPVAIRFPVSHKRYVRVKTAVGATVTTFGGSIAITDNFDIDPGYFRKDVQFFEVDPDASKVNLETQVKGVLQTTNGGTGSSS